MRQKEEERMQTSAQERSRVRIRENEKMQEPNGAGSG